jgi:hypothetical protein
MRQLNPLHHGPSSYSTAITPPPSFPWEKPLEQVLGTFTSTLNLPLLRQWAATYLTGPARQYAIHAYTHGFPTHNQQPHHTDVSTINRVTPGTPEGDAVDAQLDRLRARRRVVETSLPLIPGTRTIPLSSTAKVKVSESDFTCKVKHRPVVDGTAPHDDTSRKAYTDPREISFSVQEPFIAIVAYTLAHDISCGSLHDYEAYFESIPKSITEVAGATIWWRQKFVYVLDHVYGLTATPHSAEVHATVLQAAQQHNIDKVTLAKHLAVRRTDDTLILHPRVDEQSIDRANEAFALTCRMVNQKLQHGKTQHRRSIVLFDGLLLDFATKRVGYPVSKQLRLAVQIGRALDWPDHRTTDVMPNHVQQATRDIVKAHDLAGKRRASHGHHLTRSQLESITGSLEYAVKALVNHRSRVPPLRASWIHLTAPNARVTLTREGRACLVGFHKLFTRAQPIWYPMANMFEKPHDKSVITDASGKQGFGGHANHLYFAEPLPHEWNMHLEVMPLLISSSWIELGALFLVLHCPQLAVDGQVLLWTTDCQPAEQAWRNGRSPSPALNDLIWRIQRLCTARAITIISRHVLRGLNDRADLLSKQDIQGFLATSPTHTDTDRVRVPPLAFTRLAATLQHDGEPNLYDE